MRTRHLWFSLLAFSLVFTNARGLDVVPGIIELDTPGGPLPFWIAIQLPQRSFDDPPTVQFYNQGEIIRPIVLSHPKLWTDPIYRPSLRESTYYAVRFDSYGNELEWWRTRDSLGQSKTEGVFKVRRRNGWVRVPVRDKGQDPRYHNAWAERRLFVDLPDTPPNISSGRYSVTFSSSPDTPAVGVFEINDDHTATGTFMTTTGDYRYLAGNAAGNTLKLSTFDGAHAFLFHAELQGDGSLAGDFWSGNWWHETWTATPDPDATLPDPFAETKYRGDEADLTGMIFTALDGTPTPVGTLAPHGSPRIVIVFGSWCPNCHDATRLLTRLHAEYKDRGLRVLGLAFEHEEDPERAAERVRAYADDLGVEYPLLIAGLSDKKKASEALPVLDRVRSFPTTMFIDHDGAIRAVHTGFTGPATGDAYTDLVAGFTAHVEAMLKKRDAGADMPSD